MCAKISIRDEQPENDHALFKIYVPHCLSLYAPYYHSLSLLLIYSYLVHTWNPLEFLVF